MTDEVRSDPDLDAVIAWLKGQADQVIETHIAAVFLIGQHAYKVKKAECKKRADTMNFGVHFVKKNRWVKDCIAGKHA